MEWWLLAVPFGLIGYEFQRMAKHVNGLKDDCQRLKDEVKELRQRVGRLESESEK